MNFEWRDGNNNNELESSDSDSPSQSEVSTSSLSTTSAGIFSHLRKVNKVINSSVFEDPTLREDIRKATIAINAHNFESSHQEWMDELNQKNSIPTAETKWMVNRRVVEPQRSILQKKLSDSMTAHKVAVNTRLQDVEASLNCMELHLRSTLDKVQNDLNDLRKGGSSVAEFTKGLGGVSQSVRRLKDLVVANLDEFRKEQNETTKMIATLNAEVESIKNLLDEKVQRSTADTTETRDADVRARKTASTDSERLPEERGDFKTEDAHSLANTFNVLVAMNIKLMYYHAAAVIKEVSVQVNGIDVSQFTHTMHWHTVGGSGSGPLYTCGRGGRSRCNFSSLQLYLPLYRVLEGGTGGETSIASRLGYKDHRIRRNLDKTV